VLGSAAKLLGQDREPLAGLTSSAAEISGIRVSRVKNGLPYGGLEAAFTRAEISGMLKVGAIKTA
jgi:hypothetical protein